VIAWLRGTCLAIDDAGVVVDVHGVGYLVAVAEPERASARVGAEIGLHVHTAVSEAAIALYGFGSPAARELFCVLLGVQGVGPKAALALVGLGEPATVADAIRGGRVGELTRAKGIGRKTAETVVFKLRDKLDGFAPPAAPPPTAAPTPLDRDLISALCNLGFRAQAVERAVAQVGANPGGFDAALRAALALLRRPAA